MFWIDALKESLCRAGDHIAVDAPVESWASDLGDHFLFRLWHELPKGSARHVTKYIELFAKEKEWKVIKVNHKKFTIEIIAQPAL